MALISYRDNDEVGIQGQNSQDLLTAMQQFVGNGYHYLPTSHWRQSPISPIQKITMTRDNEKRVVPTTSVNIEGEGNLRTVLSYNAEDFLGVAEDLFEQGFHLQDAPLMFHGRYSASFVKPSDGSTAEAVAQASDVTVPDIPSDPDLEDNYTPEETPNPVETFNMNTAMSFTNKDDLVDYAKKFGFKLDKRGSLEAVQAKLKVMVS